VPASDWSDVCFLASWADLPWALLVSVTQSVISVNSSVFCVYFLCLAAYGCLQIIIHQNLWNQLELNPLAKFGDYVIWKDAEIDG
jgi:hypothetical protein